MWQTWWSSWFWCDLALVIIAIREWAVEERHVCVCVSAFLCIFVFQINKWVCFFLMLVASILIPRTCKHGAFSGIKQMTVVSYIKDFETGLSWSIQMDPCHHMCLHRRKQKDQRCGFDCRDEREIWIFCVAGSEDGGERPWKKENKSPLGVERAEKWDLP